MKTITLPIQVPEWTKWIAQDEGGGWWAYENEPNLYSYYWQGDGRQQILSTARIKNPNWRDTLRRIDE